MGSGPAGKLGLEQFGSDVQPPEIGVNRDVQDLALLIAHGSGNQEAGDAVVQRSHLAIESEIVLGFPLRRFGRGALDGGDVWQVARIVPAGFARGRASDSRSSARCRAPIWVQPKLLLHVDAASSGDAAAQGVVFEQSLDGAGEILGLIGDPDVDRVSPGQARRNRRT